MLDTVTTLKSEEIIIYKTVHRVYLDMFGLEHNSMRSFANPTENTVLIHGTSPKQLTRKANLLRSPNKTSCFI